MGKPLDCETEPPAISGDYLKIIMAMVKKSPWNFGPNVAPAADAPR